MDGYVCSGGKWCGLGGKWSGFELVVGSIWDVGRGDLYVERVGVYVVKLC